MPLGADFAAVLTRAQAGDERAWSLLYGELSGRLLRYLRARGARDAEDLVGEVFVQLARNLGRFRGNEAALRGWAFMIARNRLLDELRRGRRHPAEPLDTVDDSALGPAGDAEVDAMTRLGSDHLCHLLGALTPDQRDALLLRIAGDLSLEQAAMALGKGVGAVTQLQRRALASLRRELQHEEVSA